MEKGKAIDMLQKLLDSAKAKGDKAVESKCCVYIGNAYSNLGDYTKAVEYYKKALVIKKELGDKDGESNCFIGLGNAYSNLGDYTTAIDYQQKALVIKKELGDKEAQSNCYMQLGVAYDSLGDYSTSISYSQKALNIAEELGDKDGESNCCINLGVVYRSLGDYTKAIDYQQKALVIKKELGDKDGELYCYGNLGLIYDSLGDYSTSISYSQKALNIAEKLGDREGQSKAYTNLSLAYHSLSDYTTSIRYQKKALNIAKKIGDRKGESYCYANLGNDYSSLGDYTLAIYYWEKALNIANKIGDLYVESNCCSGLGRIYRSLGDYTKATEYYEKALAIKKEIQDVSGQAIVHLGLGIIYNEQKPEIAYSHFKRSIELTEVIGGKIVEEEYKTEYYAASSADAYQLMVQICLRLKNDNEAFEYTERSKSKVFLYLLAASNIRPSVPIVTSELKSLLDEEENYLIKLRRIQTRHSSTISSTVNAGNDVAVIPSTHNGGEVDSILSELNNIYNEIERIDPEYASLRRGRQIENERPLDKIQKILLQEANNHDAATVLVEYFITKDKLIIFVVSPHEFHIKTVELSEEKLAGYMRNYWREVIEYPSFGDIGSIWSELSSYLIEPISEYLSHAYLIYLVPYRLLHYVPIHALKLNGEPLIKSHSVAYSPSSSLLQFYKNKGEGFLKTCATFGIVFKEEAEEVAKLFDTIPYLDTAKSDVFENIDNDVLHFSCHGYFNNSDPLSSGIELKDGILTAREIFNLKLNSELVTLSACQTGINESKPGDELIGLTRALIYSGAASVIVSLWSVDATSTQELMIEFYKLLKSGKDKATALQQAQIKIMQKEEYSHPYYWAPFILVGDWE